MIATFVPGGLDAFQELGECEKKRYRKLAVDRIKEDCSKNGCVGIVTGHLRFWSEEEEFGKMVYTQNDMEIFTHILYLDLPAQLVETRRLNDSARKRPCASIHHLRKWQKAEKTELQRLCPRADSVINTGKTVVQFIQHIRRMHATIRIVVVAAVVQLLSVTRGDLAAMLEDDLNISIVALGLSDNKCTGKGTTDTGNRLFNTTHLS